MTSYSVAQPLRNKDTNHKLMQHAISPILIHAMAVGDEFFDPLCESPSVWGRIQRIIQQVYLRPRRQN
jgi:hypothetical protein